MTDADIRGRSRGRDSGCPSASLNSFIWLKTRRSALPVASVSFRRSNRSLHFRSCLSRPSRLGSVTLFACFCRRERRQFLRFSWYSRSTAYPRRSTRNNGVRPPPYQTASSAEAISRHSDSKSSCDGFLPHLVYQYEALSAFPSLRCRYACTQEVSGVSTLCAV